MTSSPEPLRIKRLTLTDFRAFPGPAPAPFDFDSKNLLVYGENGSGKSSIFHALSGVFSLKSNRNLRAFKNVFSGEPDTTCEVAIEFNDGGPIAVWGLVATSGAIGSAPVGSHAIGGPGPAKEHHPTAVSGGSDLRVTQAALRRACLDYRALLDTNYKHGDQTVNLFEIALDKLLGDFPVTVAGGITRTVGELWQAVHKAKPTSRKAPAIARVNQACVNFNVGFNEALTRLQPLVGTLLAELIGAEVTVAPFSFGGITYTDTRFKSARVFAGLTLTLDVSFRTHKLPTPQHFLNEARLSALALSIYLAGRLACTPIGASNALKLLVLDDVLIGLDHSNRLPVLDVLRKYFADWQVVLLTHDRIWFEMARFHVGNSEQWKCLEVYEGEDTVRGIPAPTTRPTGHNAARATLGQAGAFLADHHIPAAANYTRAAFELALKSFCERFGVPVAFKTDSRHVDTENLLSAVEGWFKAHASKECLAGVIERVKLFRKVVLNPYSHASPPNIARAEVQGAIAAVESVLAVLDTGGAEGGPFQAAQTLIAKTPPSNEDLQAALGFLRVAFLGSLRRFGERKHLHLVFKEQAIDGLTLWKAVIADQARLFPPPHTGLPAQIEVDRPWLISPVSDASLVALTHADLVRLSGLLMPVGSSKLMLDLL